MLVDGREYGQPGKEVFQHYDWARVPSVTNRYTTRVPKVRGVQGAAVAARIFTGRIKIFLKPIFNTTVYL